MLSRLCLHDISKDNFNILFIHTELVSFASSARCSPINHLLREIVRCHSDEKYLDHFLGMPVIFLEPCI